MTIKMSLLCKEQRPKLREALISAFPKKNGLERMLLDELNERLDNIVSGDNLTDIVNNLIDWAESKGRLEELVLGAVRNNPGNKELQDLLESIDIKLLWNKEKENIPISELELKNIISRLEKIENFDLSVKKLESILHPKAKDKIEKIKDNKIKRTTKIVLLLEIILKDYPKDDDNGKQLILKFSEQLKQEQPPNRNHGEGNQKKDKYRQPYLVIIVQPASLPGKCILKAFLAFEYSTKEDSEPNFIPLRNYSLSERITNNTNQENFVCNFKEKEINQQINQFIRDSYGEIYKKSSEYSDEDLIIEIFLPTEYIFEPIDMWKIPYGMDGKVEIGIQYRMVVRAWERLNSENKLFKCRLSQAWKKVNNLTEAAKQQEIEELIVHLSTEENKDTALASLLNGKIGLKLTCVPPKSKKKTRERLLNAIFTEGVPIVIWTRCSELPGKDIMTEIGKFLTPDSFQGLDNLFKLIHDERKAANKQSSPERYIGNYLGILCDECDRLPYLVNNILHNDEDMLRIGR